MFRREHQECSTVKRVGSCSENADPLFHVLNLKIDLGALASPNPVTLEQFDSFWPIQALEFVEQSLRVCSDTQHPLPQWSSHNREATNLAFSIYDFLIRQDCAQFRTPVHWDISDVSEANSVRIGSAIG